MYKGIDSVGFVWYDYFFFVTFLTVSLVIGVYFGFFGTKQASRNEYLLGGKQMKTLPVGMSIIASVLSAISILAVPTDVYHFGANYFWGQLSIIINCLITAYVTLPIFYKTGVTSIYAYLEKRFDYKTRMISSLMCTLMAVLYLPMIIYIPALTLEAVTKINVYVSALIVSGVCIFYTTFGGIKAVVWTDIIQFSVTIFATLAVCFLGFQSAGGFESIWSKSVSGNRLDVFDFGLDLTKRDTFWICVIGYGFKFMRNFCFSQGLIQKLLSLPTMKNAKRAILVFTVGIVLINITMITIGLIVYALYFGCDPFTSGLLNKGDQLIPYFVLDVSKKIPGLSGLFITGIFGAALSTLSSDLNALSATVYEDFITKIFPKQILKKYENTILKLIVLVFGVVCVALVFAIEGQNDLWAIYITLDSLVSGPLLGLFLLGMFFPKVNKKGAKCGCAFGLAVMSWIIVTTFYYKSKGIIGYTPKPVSIEDCDFFVNKTISGTKAIHNVDSPPFVLFRISFLLYTFVGSVITIIVGMIVSYFTKEYEIPVDEDLVSPFVRRFIHKKENVVHQTVSCPLMENSAKTQTRIVQ